MESSPQFSVVVATHGRGPLLGRLLDSLEQSRRHAAVAAEIIVVDSTPTAERGAILAACERVGATLLAGPLSVRRKRNLGTQSATGEWLLFIDSDCTATPEFFGAYQQVLRDRPELRAAAGPTVFTDAETAFTRLISASSLLAPFRQPASATSLLWATTSNLIVRRDVFTALGGFRQDLPFRLGGDDTDFCLRLNEAGHSIAAVPGAICLHSWATWSAPSSVVRRSFRWGWMHAILLRDHPRYRRLDAPGLPAHALATLVVAALGAITGRWALLSAPALFVAVATLVHALWAARRSPAPGHAFVEDLALALVELPFGFGRALGAVWTGSFFGIVYRLDADDDAMDGSFAEVVRGLWSDHFAFLVIACLAGWAA